MRASGYELPLPEVEVASQERPLKVDLVFSLCDVYCAHLAALQQQGPHLSAYCRTHVARPLKQAFKKHLRAVTPATTCSTRPPTDPAPPPPHICHALPPPPFSPLTPLRLSHRIRCLIRYRMLACVEVAWGLGMRRVHEAIEAR